MAKRKRKPPNEQPDKLYTLEEYIFRNQDDDIEDDDDQPTEQSVIDALGFDPDDLSPNDKK